MVLFVTRFYGNTSIMLNDIDALVLFGHRHLITSEIPRYHHDNIQQALSYVQSGQPESANANYKRSCEVIDCEHRA